MRYTISFLIATHLASAAQAEVPAVVTDIPPVHSLVAMVLGDLGAPVLLLDRGADAHDFQLRPSRAQAVQDAGLVVWVGPAMSPWLDRVMDGMGGSIAQLPLLSAPGTVTITYDHVEEQEEESHDHGDGHDHGDDHGHDHGHDHGPTDPHAWLDPGNAAVWIDAIAAELARLDPANAATYASNADAARERIAEAEAQAQTALATVRDRPVILNHDAYAYFAAHFGLSSVAHISDSDAAAPGAAGLRDLIASVEGKGTACVFPEANHDEGLAEQVAQATGARLGGALDPEGAGLEPGTDLYPALLAGIAETIAACLTAP